MKKIILISAIAISCATSECMEIVKTFKHAPREKYPAEIGYCPIEEVLTTVEPIPDDVKKDVDVFLKENPAIIEYCRMPQDPSDLIQHHNNQKAVPGNMSKSNITLYTSTKKSVIKIAHVMSRIRTIASSQGLDPYQIKYDGSTLPKIFSFEGPTLQHTTIPIAASLLEKFNPDGVQGVPTWFYHLPGNSTELDDRNYIAVQQALPHNFKQFSLLSTEEKKDFCNNFDLEGFYGALKYIHYAFPSEENLWVDIKNYHLALPDLESPNNEGLGINAKYG
jgi:hypothetical protein